MKTQYHYLSIIKKQLEELRKLNSSRYTLRAMAKRIQVSHSMLSQVLSQKKMPSLQLAQRLCSELQINGQDQLEIERSVMAQSQLSAKYFPSDRALPHLVRSQESEKQILFQKLFSAEDVADMDALTSQLRTQAFEILLKITSNEIPPNSQIVLSVERPKEQV